MPLSVTFANLFVVYWLRTTRRFLGDRLSVSVGIYWGVFSFFCGGLVDELAIQYRDVIIDLFAGNHHLLI